MARQRGFPRRFQGSRRKSAWGLGPQEPAQQITATGSILWANGVVLVASDAATIVRIRGHALLYLDAATAGGDGFVGALGIGVVTSAAFVAGVASVPTPITESDWEGWMWHQFFQLRAGGTIDASVAGDVDQVNSTSAAMQIDIDTKAMRKINSDETLMGVIEVTEIGTAQMQFVADTRDLLLLH